MTNARALETAPSAEIAEAPDISAIRSRWGTHLDSELSEHTRRAYLYAFDRFINWLEQRDPDSPAPPLAQISHADIVEYREYLRRRYSLSTVKIQLSAIRSFYDWAIGIGAPIMNPARAVKARGRRSLAGHLRDPLSDEEVRRLLETCSRNRPIDLRDRAIIAFMLYCALRTVEIQRATFGDLEVREGRQILWVWRKGRAEPDDFVVIPSAAERALHAWIAVHPTGSGPLFCTLGRLKGRSMSLRTLRAMLKARLRKAGIRGMRKSAHSLRHTAITCAIHKGASPLQVRRMAGHSSIRTTLRYFHETDRLEDPAEDRIRYGLENESDGSRNEE